MRRLTAKGAKILDAAVIEGDVYIYVNDKDVEEAAFYLNDPERQGGPYNVEDSGALDLEPSYALFDSTSLEDGVHTLTTALKKGNETRVVTATFLVDNGGCVARSTFGERHARAYGRPNASRSHAFRQRLYLPHDR